MGDEESSLAALGRREQKKQETRRTLRDVALDLALEQGVDSLTVEAISEAAQVSPRTFFNYFARKEDALVSEAAEATDDLHRMIIERPDAESPLRTLRTVITGSESFGAQNTDRERILARQKLVQQHPQLLSRQLTQYARVEQTFAAALGERLGVDPDHDLRPALLAAIAVSVVRVAMRRWTADGRTTLERQIEAAFDRVEQEDLNVPAAATTS